MPNEMANTITSGARMNTHFSGLTNIATPKAVRYWLPMRPAAADWSGVTAAM